MSAPKADALPLGYAPMVFENVPGSKFNVAGSKMQEYEQQTIPETWNKERGTLNFAQNGKISPVGRPTQKGEKRASEKVYATSPLFQRGYP